MYEAKSKGEKDGQESSEEESSSVESDDESESQASGKGVMARSKKLAHATPTKKMHK